MPRAARSSQPKRACDECRVRKVKCDTALPQCSNCRMSDLQCSYNAPVKKRGPKFRVAPHGFVPPAEEAAAWPATPSTSSEPFLSQGPTFAPTPTPDAERIAPESISQHSVISTEAKAIHNQLLSTLHALCPEVVLEQLASKCIDIFMQFMFPLVPIVHEPTLRASVALLSPAAHISIGSPGSPFSMASPDGFPETDDIFAARSFGILTAICANLVAKAPAYLLPGDSKVASTLLDASRKMLALYHDRDIGNPDSSSLVIRMLQSAGVHNAGKTSLSWFILGEAIRLAFDMRIYDEASLYNLDPVEAQLRRNAFWQLYTADRSAAILNYRPFTMTEFNFESPVSLQHRTWEETPLIDIGKAYNTRHFEHSISLGFKKCQDLWDLASNLLLELRLFQRRQSQLSNEKLPELQQEAQQEALTGAYLEFMSVLDKIPASLQNPELGAPEESSILSDEAIQYQSRCFWAQRVNLEVTFHCLRLITLQKFADCNLSSLLGVSQQPLMLAFKKTEIAQDMLRVIQNAPFEALQANGEPCVEKIRQVGASLLEIVQNIEVPHITARAKAVFSTLLDILARLDSKASDTLCLD